MKNVTFEEDLYLTDLTVKNSLQLKKKTIEQQIEDDEVSLSQIKTENEEIDTELGKLQARKIENEKQATVLETQLRKNQRRKTKVEKQLKIQDEDSDEDIVENFVEQVKR